MKILQQEPTQLMAEQRDLVPRRADHLEPSRRELELTSQRS